ncbi:MAG: FAD-dependent oxidoreductase [Solirubrobacterales bacterium]|nr:FAD-dependent oxidoreductase [Solirubrobacterales bacterium]
MSESRPEILIAGSGPGALEATLGLSGSKHLVANVALISPQLEFQYRPNMVMEPFGVTKTARYAVAEVIRHPNVTQWQGTLERVDAAASKAYTPEGDEFNFDALVIATGTNTHADLADPAVTFGVPGSLDKLKKIVSEIDAGSVQSVLFTAPSGPTWQLPIYECSLMCAERAERQWGQQIVISIATPEAEPLEVFGAENSAAVRRLCAELGVVVHTGTTVEAFDGTTAHFSDGTSQAADHLFAMPRLTGRAPDGIPTDENGFIHVDANQLVERTTNVYAVGDVTDFRFKQGGLASMQADAAISSIETELGDREAPEPFVREIEAILIAASRRVAMRARIDEETSLSIAIEQPTGPTQKIFSRLLSERLREISPL